MQGIAIDQVTFHGAGQADAEKGLLGWTSFVVNGVLRVDGVTVRRTFDGRYTLSFPARQVGRRRHFYVRPLDDCTRREIEDQVLAAIGLGEEVRR